MDSLEALTKEELIGWIRENHPEIDEEKTALNILIHRRDMIWQNQKELRDRGYAVECQITKLIQESADGPIKSGMRLRRWSVAAQRKYDELDRERKAIAAEYKDWFEKDQEVNKSIMDIQEVRTRRVIALAEEAIERTKIKLKEQG